MGKRVVEGGPIRFRDDLPIAEAEIPKPLGVPAIALLPDALTVWYKGRFFELDRGKGEGRARVWDRAYSWREAEPASKREERYFSDHRRAIEKAGDEWMQRVIPGATLGPSVAHVLKDKVQELCAVPMRPPQRDVGRGKMARREDGSLLAELHGYERLLHVDGKVYDLLSLGEYVARFEKAMDPKFAKELQAECERASPADVVELMGGSLDRVDKKTYGVIKGKVHYDRRTLEIHLDGTYFIPEYLGAAAEYLAKVAALVDKRLKLEAIDRLFA